MSRIVSLKGMEFIKPHWNRRSPLVQTGCQRLVALGLKDLAKATNPGLRALIEVAGCGDGEGMTAYDLGFRLGPRINAAGRMDAGRAVVDLFANDLRALEPFGAGNPRRCFVRGVCAFCRNHES
jgi:single-stranded DNA-specific DHH superfamily exonuclease